MSNNLNLKSVFVIDCQMNIHAVSDPYERI